MCLKNFSRKTVNLGLMKIRIDKSSKPSVILNHERINHISKAIENSLYFLRIDVLSRRSENHAL